MSMGLTTLFGPHPDVRIVAFLAAHPDLDYTLSDLARSAGVSRPAAYRVVDRLLESRVLTRTRRVGTSWFYQLDTSTPLAASLVAFENELGAAPRRRRAATRRSRSGVRS